MGVISTSTIAAIDLVNLSKDIAQLNLGYLGISVAILGVLGGVFVYFNIKPFRDALEKQERTIEELKKEAKGLLALSADQSERVLENFKVDQSKIFNAAFEQHEEKLGLETASKIQEIEKVLSDKIESTAESKDLKLRDIILSEASNRLATLEKELTLGITTLKEEITKDVSQVKSANAGLKAAVKELSEKIKELQVYKFSKEGKMGAIIVSIELLQEAIDEYLKIREILGKGDKLLDKQVFGYKIKMRLEGLIKEIGDYELEQEYISKISEQLKRLANEEVFAILVNQLKEKLRI